MTEPVWMPLELLIRLHDRQIDIHGGLPGTRDPGLLESAVARPLNAWSYGETDLFTLASLYAGGLINNHPFLDGNKRIGFLAALLFGAAGALGPALQSVGVTQGYYFFNAAPYVLTLLIMIMSTSPKRSLRGAPAELSITK
jgi:hypothetical protein